MAATKEAIARWFQVGKQKGATHMVVVCDTFDHDDYPVYVMPGEDPRKAEADFNSKPMQRVMEVYAFHLSLQDQLKKDRVFNYQQAGEGSS